jgi:hypothetical protein
MHLLDPRNIGPAAVIFALDAYYHWPASCPNPNHNVNLTLFTGALVDQKLGFAHSRRRRKLVLERIYQALKRV